MFYVLSSFYFILIAHTSTTSAHIQTHGRENVLNVIPTVLSLRSAFSRRRNKEHPNQPGSIIEIWDGDLQPTGRLIIYFIDVRIKYFLTFNTILLQHINTNIILI